LDGTCFGRRRQDVVFVFAALDESTPELPNGIAYVMTGVVLLANEAAARSAAQAVVPPGRLRPFHWHREGPVAREAMMSCLVETGAIARVYVHTPTGRRRQEAARAKALGLLVPELVAEGAEHLCIESRGSRADHKDRAVLLDSLNPKGGSSAMTYDWRSKNEPLLWLADGVCGAVADFLLQAEDKLQYYDQLQACNTITGLTYISQNVP